MFPVLFLCWRAKDVWWFYLHQSMAPLDHDSLHIWLKDFNSNFCDLTTYIFLKMSGIQEIGAQVFSLLYYVLKAFTSPDPRRIQSHVRVVSWIRPNFGLVSLNVDDNMFVESILDGFSSLICNHTWPFLHGFLGNISCVEILATSKCFVSQT